MASYIAVSGMAAGLAAHAQNWPTEEGKLYAQLLKLLCDVVVAHPLTVEFRGLHGGNAVSSLRSDPGRGGDAERSRITSATSPGG